MPVLQVTSSTGKSELAKGKRGKRKEKKNELSTTNTFLFFPPLSFLCGGWPKK